MSKEELKIRALAIRDEVIESANTANRVGQLLYDMIAAGTSGVDIITTTSDTKATEDNVFSALRTLHEIKLAKEEIDGKYLRKDIDDTAHGIISFEKEIKSMIFIDGFGPEGKGWRIDDKGNAIFDSINVRKNLLIGNHIGSPEFVSGFPNGFGWDLSPYTFTNAAGVDEKKYRLEIDDIVIRGRLRVFEMIVSQLRGEDDNVIFAGMMKVDHYDPATGRIYLDTDEGVIYNPFRPGDILMVQRFGGMPGPQNDYNVIKQYELQVTEAQVGSLADKEKRLDWIKFKNFVGSTSDIAAKDVLTRVDSATDSTRKGIVKIFTIDEKGAPYLDVVYGMKTDKENSLKARMGNLSGIRTKHNVNLDGLWGLYANGAYIENSSVILENGNTIEQEFTAMNGTFSSKITEINKSIDGVNSTIGTMQTAISQNSKEIGLKASEKYVDEATGAVKKSLEAKLSVHAEQISGVVSRVTDLENASAGWVTTADGNRLWASKELENGNKIISYINQTATTTTIKASKINLIGAVSYNSFNSALKVDFDDKVGSTKLANTLTNYVLNKDLNSKLDGYALASDLSDLVSSNQLSNALTSYATQNYADNKSQSEATSAFNTLKKALVDGSTTILGGFISTDLLDVDTIFANQATIGGFVIGKDNLSSADGIMKLNNNSIDFRMSNYPMRFTVGLNTYSDGGKYRTPLFVANWIGNGSGSFITENGSAIVLGVGRATAGGVPQSRYQRWIDCIHIDGYGSKFQVESRYTGDEYDMERTFINVGEFPSNKAIEKMPIPGTYYKQHEYHPIYIDVATGYLCWKY